MLFPRGKFASTNHRHYPDLGSALASGGFLHEEMSLYSQASGHGFISSVTKSNISGFSQAKSEALDNIYRLLKQNIKSCNAKR